MLIMQTRRRFLATLSLAGAAVLLPAPRPLATEEPLETTRIRLSQKIIADSTDWRFFNELKRELKG